MIVYLHGFASSGQSIKARRLRDWLRPVPVFAPTYPHPPRRAVRFLLDYLETELAQRKAERLLLVGSSLGGFYGEYLARRFRCPLVLINPALDPVRTLKPCVGENRRYYSGETFRFLETDLMALRDYAVERPCDTPVPTLLLVDWGDEVVDADVALRRYEACGRCVAFEGGSHGFDHLRESLQYIQELYRMSGRPSA